MTKCLPRGSLNLLCGLTLIASCASGQWLNYPTPGIPRLPDGKPNLAAPTPRTADGKPDLSGVWTIIRGPSIVGDLKPGDILHWAEALIKQRQENLGKNDPSTVGFLLLGPRFNFAG